MPKASPARARLPRGTKPVIQAFFDALEAIPDASRAEVAKAAHAGIRDALKAEREEAKQERARERSTAPGSARPAKRSRPRPVVTEARWRPRRRNARQGRPLVLQSGAQE